MKNYFSKKAFLVLLVTLLAFGLGATAAVAKALPKKLTIATEGAYPPYNFVNSKGNLDGFEIDLGRAMCKQMHVKCSFIAQDWDGIIPGLLAKKYDAIIASLYITKEREKHLAFSARYYKVPSSFVVPKSSDVKISKKGLADKIVGVQRGSSWERMMRDKYPDIQLQLYPSTIEVLRDLRIGRIDLALGDVVEIKEDLLDQSAGDRFELRGPKFSNPKWYGKGAGVAVRKDDKYIADAFTKAIHALRKNGTYQKISNKWFGMDVYGSQ